MTMMELLMLMVTDKNEQQWNAIITALSSLLQLPNYDDKVTMPIIKLLMANSTTPM